jgi:hypothetical protein
MATGDENAMTLKTGPILIGWMNSHASSAVNPAQRYVSQARRFMQSGIGRSGPNLRGATGVLGGRRGA